MEQGQEVVRIFMVVPTGSVRPSRGRSPNHYLSDAFKSPEHFVCTHPEHMSLS